MKLSIVTTLYKSSPFIIEFYERISATANKITDDYEIIFVNDGSPDNSLELVVHIQKKDARVSIIDLSKNFGHHCAMMTGLSYATGDYIFLIDCDLEEDPEYLEIFWHQLKNNSDFDLIYGAQETRKGKFFERALGKFFYKLLNFLSDIKIPKNALVIRLMSKQYLKNLLRHTERELVFVGISALTGFQQKAVCVTKKDKGSTTYSFTKKIDLAVNFITSLTSKPLVYIFYAGLCITLFSLTFSAYLIFRKLLLNISVPGWISLMTSIWLLGGIIIFCLGVVGIYISKIFIEVKQRPYSIVKAIIETDPSARTTNFEN